MAIGETLAALSSSKTLILKPSPSPTTSSSSTRSLRHWIPCFSRHHPSLATSSSAAAAAAAEARRSMVEAFDPTIPLAEALTPPSMWYIDSSFLALEFDRVFFRGWRAVGGNNRLGNVEFVICRDANGNLRAFHNVCRHHASLLTFGSGQKSCFECPYHGWTYGLDGELLKATRISGIKNFNKNNFGLKSINVGTWGPFVLVNLDQKILNQQDITEDIVGKEWLGSASNLLSTNGIDTSLKHVSRREYTIECNWKVFCDNYLDGGYHVPYAHKGLASGLELNSYETLMFEKVSVQRCESASVEQDSFDRLGSKAIYAFVYPNFMINRYGPWMDTNLAIPLGPTKCQVIFDYFLDPSLADDKAFIERSLEDSERVQIEDIALCEGVQRGLESPAYDSGRYAPSVEMAMHHFHSLLHASLVDT
ncbi:Choline monooxygenase, chloroplastic [Ananas comosus]|uniref:Choline monooxygenase, chloroplastic n=2 Tax=Ananas comosus TaxID=4615 RepID=A0A199UJZ0_ANACO|nr:Choline monooxygenase, chloroplastic [Ananas comosus]